MGFTIQGGPDFGGLWQHMLSGRRPNSFCGSAIFNVVDHVSASRLWAA